MPTKQRKATKKAKSFIGPLSKKSTERKNRRANAPGNRNVGASSTVFGPKPRMAGAAAAVCALTDPFCEHAQGSRLPDDSGAQTLTLPVRQLVSLNNCNAGGYGAYAITPSWYTTAFTGVGAACTFSATSPYTATTSGASVFSTHGHRVRVVSWGVIVRASGTATECKGNLLVSQPNYMSATGVVTVGSYLSPTTETFPIATGMEVWVRARPNNAKLSKTFISVSGWDTASSASMGQPTILLQVVGGTASGSPYLTAEIFVNLEYEIVYESTMAPYLPAPEPPRPRLLQVVDTVNAKAPIAGSGGTDASDSTVRKIATTAINSLGSYAMSELLEALPFML